MTMKLIWVEAEVTPNAPKFMVLECPVRAEDKNSVVVFVPKYGNTWRADTTELGKLIDESSDGWYRVRMWLHDPSPEELHKAKEELLRKLEDKVEKLERRAYDRRTKLTRLKEELRKEV